MVVAWLVALALELSLAEPAATPLAAEAPAGSDVRWKLVGPGGGGWIQSIAWGRTPGRLYVGCDVGGFYDSVDGGQNFQIRNDGLRDYFVESIAVHPTDDETILLGTQSGLHRTTDGGRHWTWIREGFPPLDRHKFSAPISIVAFDRQSPAVVYCGIGRPRLNTAGAGAIYRSDDAGLSWRLISAGQLPADAVVGDIEVWPDRSGTILAATSRGVFRSEDHGKTWIDSSAGLTNRHGEELAVAAADPRRVYLTVRTTARKDDAFDGGVWRSDDGGRSWSATGEGLPRTLGRRDQADGMTARQKEIAVDPHDPDRVYVGDQSWVAAGVYGSEDGGRHWSKLTQHTARRQPRPSNMDYGWIGQWGPHVECMAVSSRGEVAFGTSGHVYTSADRGQSWRQRYCRMLDDGRFAGNGLEVTCCQAVVADPHRQGRLWCCYFDIGLLASDDGGKSFRTSREGMRHAGNCFTVLVDPQRPDDMWAATGWWTRNSGDVCRSTDGGKTWRPAGADAGLPDAQTRHLVLDPSSPPGGRRLWALVRGHGVYESADGGATWRSIGGDLPAEALDAAGGLLLAGRPPRLVAAFGGPAARGGGVYAREPTGEWRRRGEPPFASVTDLAADPSRPETLYVAARESYDRTLRRTFAGGLFRSDDGGATWQHLLQARFASSVALRPGDPQTVYVATTDHPYHDEPLADGVLVSRDGGATWRKENAGLSHLNVTGVDVDPLDPDAVFASTAGNSAFVGRLGK